MHIEVKTLTSVEYSDAGLELTKKDFDRLDSIARKLASTYNGWYGLTYDDVYDVTWEKISSLIKEGARDFALIYRCCKNTVLDLIRKTVKESGRKFNVDDELMDKVLYCNRSGSYDANENVNNCNTKWNPDFNNMYVTGKVSQDCFGFMELLGLFEKRTPEWEWMLLVGIRNKIIEVDPVIYNKLFTDRHSVDCEVSKLMGYNHQSNNGYRAVKWRVQKAVSEYLALPEK